MDIFTVAVEAFTNLTSVQYILVAVLLVFVSACAYIATRIHERAKMEAEIERRVKEQVTKQINEMIRDMTMLVAIEQDPDSKHYGTYVEIGDTFVHDENALGVSDTSTVTTVIRAHARKAKPRITEVAEDVPLR